MATFFSSGTYSVVAAGTSAVKYRNSAAARPHTDCIAYLCRDFRPLGSRLTILIQSSSQPIAPKPTSTASSTQT
jgi:hypothetical protein